MATNQLVLLTLSYSVLFLTLIFATNAQQQNQFDQILSELDILTRQQLAQAGRISTTTSPSVTASSTTPSTTTSTEIIKKYPHPRSSALSSSPVKPTPRTSSLVSASSDTFTLPSRYDPNEIPRYRRGMPLPISLNITILDSFVDRSESSMIVELEIRESWRDSRLRLRSKKPNGEDEHDEPEEEIEHKAMTQTHLLNSEWSNRLWHPVSRLLGNAQIVHDSMQPDDSKKKSQKFQALEHESSIETLYVHANRSTARVLMSIKLRIKTPMYACTRDNPRRYPFDRITCKLTIANALYDHQQLIYNLGTINWRDNGHRTGEFYLRNLQHSLGRDRILDLDVGNSEHSSIELRLHLSRQIGDYVLNVYLLHFFLLALCLSSFWLSIDAIVIRLALSIIVLVIIKFQTIQNLKDDRRVVSALSVWTFGISCLVIMAILAHILSYYSNLNDWNTRILKFLVKKRSSKSKTDIELAENGSPGNGAADTANKTTNSSPAHRNRFHKYFEQLSVRFLDWSIAHSSTESLTKVNIIDVASRWALSIVYITFVCLYFVNFVF